ncbi:translation initiation factor 3 subunit E [Strigomonas culicis]|nr:translation initiation factor 3 subunit E [Strigomonas culicis]|eukprot:EPY31889.1 translation initiation factor 3 subunit E [Strigomonas culicis]
MLSLCQCISGSDLPMDYILWGKLVCDSAAAAWQSAVETADRIHDNQNSADDEAFRMNKGTTVRARAWLLHGVLFPFFKGGTQYHTKLLFYIFDHKSDYVYRRVVETVCPHYLRYICAAVLLNRTRHNNFREAAAMANSIYEYSDVLTRLVSLIHKCELEDAIALLPQVGDLLDEDFFLLDFKEDILENARLLIFQRYMAIHSVVSIPHVAERLNMTKEDAEVWLVNLISSSKQRAKIDSVNEQLNMVPQSKAVDAVVYDKLENGPNSRRS